jgi:hypothetical protein
MINILGEMIIQWFDDKDTTVFVPRGQIFNQPLSDGLCTPVAVG